MTKSLIVIAHDIRSAHNVGSLMRTCEALGAQKLILSGYTPHPSVKNDSRLPHIGIRQAKQINKTALGAEQSLDWEYKNDVNNVINDLHKDGYVIAGLEQAPRSTKLNNFNAPKKLAILLGREVTQRYLKKWMR
jgi:23S rRNA (guanosine2251-2'-O)-methyltransferase